ncbi:hypothetical protein D3C87_1259700 [compost metagenome]
MEKYLVTNDFIDFETGDLIKKGAIFEADAERAERLRAADVVGKEAIKEPAKADTAKKATADKNKDKDDENAGNS